MASSAKKRPRTQVKETRADCPFTVTIESEFSGKGLAKPQRKIYPQLSPFSPTGNFKSYETLDIHYSVEPSTKWQEMARYNSFILNGSRYLSEGFIYVANNASIERQKDSDPSNGPRRGTEDEWVARILEIRASDKHHVYARVYWMYRPEDLPSGTTDGKKWVKGRQPYHGTRELVASNHMDIINVVSVTAKADVKQWIRDSDGMENDLYWRQAIDARNLELSKRNPDV